jgi:tetratricopeptide (TPR) repeat protein
MSQLTPMIALLGWIPVVLLLFVLLPARRAVVASLIAAWLLLPPVGIDLPGIPNYDKASAATLGILLATVFFEPHRLLRFRLRWFDTPMLLWSLCPFVSSVLNGMGTYDGASAALRQTIAWFLPYLVGRLYLTDIADIRELALGMIIGGACLIPFCLFEMKMSQILLQIVYGISKYEGMRLGGFRPAVFFSTGLELGLWMNAVTLVAWWLWRNGELKTLALVPGGVVFAALLLTTLACRSTGATVLFLSGMGALWTCWKSKKKWALWALLFAVPLYCFVRTTNLWSGSHAVEVVRRVSGEERAYSLEFRLVNEDLLIAKAWQQPSFGWGRWGRNLVYEDSGRVLSIIDGMWLVALGNYGFVGLVLMTTSMLLPAALFLKRFPVAQWGHPSLVPAAAVAVVTGMSQLDGLFNGMLNVVYVAASGGLVNLAMARAVAHCTKPGHAMTSAETPAIQYQSLGRVFRDQGQYLEAKNAWLCALSILTKQATAQPSQPILRRQWCDCANDLAWLFAAADPVARDPANAVALATQATAAFPDCSTYWNTLGAAYYRTHDFPAAITALEHARLLNGEGTAFDDVFLAMAYAKLGDNEQAKERLALAVRWVERHCPGHAELLRLCDEAGSAL